MTEPARSFDSVLVANRGEIARRVFTSARAMGLRTVAVYVEADADTPFVADADDAMKVDSYLDADAIIAAASASGAGAIHPGYGFLAENPSFATAVEQAGLVWVGPTADAIAAMGDKIAAKALAVEADVPVLPSTDDVEAFEEIGFPLLVKAAAGGGGKGMRIVESAGELDDAITGARREALSGFGDDRVFAERYVARARHIEIQILGDAHGQLVHLGERECSIQRRHQKIIEESPSPAVTPAQRQTMGEAALRLAAALGYRSAGTVEFLVDDETGDFFFLEVNTRLQVEHPVTEQVTGIDLVREQLRIARGEPLGYHQDNVTFAGHAVEARLYAEDPANDFLPAAGVLEAFEPAPEPQVRWDTGVASGTVIGTDFDPMIAKVTAHAATRDDACGVLALALERLHLGGVVTNRDFLAAVLRHERFRAGDTTTDFIARVQPPARRPITDNQRHRLAVGAALWLHHRHRTEATVLATLPGAWRIGRLPAERVELSHQGEKLTVHYRRARDGSFILGPAGDGGVARLHEVTADLVDVEVDGHRQRLRVSGDGRTIHLTGGGGGITLAVVPRFSVPEPDVPGGAVAAPMPGKVIELRVEVGDEVTAGQVVAVLEAMKMENHLRAAEDGTVLDVRVSVGDQVEKDVLLMVIDTGSDHDEEGHDG